MRRLVILCLLVGCGDSGKDVVTKNKAAIEAQLARLKAIAADVASAPTVDTEAVAAPAAVLVFDFGDSLNAAVVYPGHLTDPCNGEELHWFEEGRAPSHETQILVPPHDDMENWLVTSACVLTSGTDRYGSEVPDAELVKWEVANLLKIKFVLVPRLRFVRPTYNIESDGKVKTFNPGAIVGDVVLYELATGKRLGGFRVGATNATEVEDSSHSTFDSLQLDLIKQTEEQIARRLIELAPGAQIR